MQLFPADFIASLPPFRQYVTGELVALLTLDEPHAQRLVAEMQRWFERVAPDQQAHLASRLRDYRNEHNFVSAFYELALHEYLLQLGYMVSLNEPVGPGDVDLAASNAHSFLVEVATIFPPRDEERADRRADQVLAALDSIEDADYGICVQFRREPTAQDRPSQIRRRVLEVLADVSRAGMARSGEYYAGPIAYELVRLPAGQRSGFVVSSGTPVRFRRGSGQARQAVQRKVKRYKAVKKLRQPFVVALCDGGNWSDLDTEIEWELIGHPVYQLQMGAGEPSGRWVRTATGLLGPHGGYTRLGAILYCARTWREGDRVMFKMRVWHNPRAAHPLPLKVFDELPQVGIHLLSDREFRLERLNDHGQLMYLY